MKTKKKIKARKRHPAKEEGKKHEKKESKSFERAEHAGEKIEARKKALKRTYL